ncbi:terminase large subunit domain-containing protein [Klebsiella pneumoniae]
MDLTLLDHIQDIPAYVSTLTKDEKLSVLNYLQACKDYREYNKLEFFEPEEWQKNAITLGSTENHRMVCAGNRLGKTFFSTYEAVVHATGKYPDWWQGHRFTKPISVLVMGYDWTQIARSGATQECILGTVDKRGSGWIPRSSITKMVSKTGLQGVCSTVYVKHYDSAGICDGESRLTFDCYSGGQDTLMGMSLDFALLDEQCPKEIFSQVKKRLWDKQGKSLYVATPEKGLDEVIKQFWDDDGIHHSGLIHVTLWDSQRYTHEQKVLMNNEIEPWARQFSIEGIPSAGSGAVFAGILKENLLDNSFTIGKYWKRMAAADLGYSDDMVFSFIAYNPDDGMYYLYDELSYTKTDAIICAAGVRPMQHGYVPMILPQDCMAERGLGATYQSIFEGAGLVLTKEYARNWHIDPTGKDRTVKSGILFMRELMLTGKLKVHPKCTGFLKEFSLYSYDEDGKFIDKDNHFIDSFRYNITAINKFGVSEYDHETRGTNKVISTNEWSKYTNTYDTY